MTSTDQNLSMYAGTRVSARFTVTDTDSDTPDDLTAYSVLRWAVVPYDNASTVAFRRHPVLEKKSTTAQASTGGNEIDIAGDNDERADVQLIAADTEDLEGTYYHELEGVDSNGNAIVLAVGTLTILPNVINP